MRNRAVSALLRFALPAVLGIAVYSFGASQSGSSTTPGRKQPHTLFLQRHAIPGTTDLQLIIELEDPPVVRMLTARRGASMASQGGTALRLDSPQALSYRAQLARTQELMKERLRALAGVEIQGSTDVVLNAIIARVPVDRYFEIQRLPGVKRVYFSRLHRMNLNAAAPLVNAPGLWARVSGGRTNAGQGVKIGIIDSGIDITNPMFSDSTPPTPSSYPPGFPKYDSTADQPYTNHKVIVARNYISLLSNPQRIQTAIDEVGHGSFVSGCAAGKLVTAPDTLIGQISGMAPAAFLGSYKIFGTPGINDGATTAAIVAAIDDAVSDGMDVLNLSLGGLDYVPPSEDPEVAAIENAISAGKVVALAAGNSGPGAHTIETPGSAPDALAVGAVWNSRTLSPQLHVTGPGAVPANLQNVAYANGSGPAISSNLAATQVVDVASLDGSGLACSTLPANSLSGKIALIKRGICFFSAKVTNAATAGASAVIAYDNVPGESPFSMSGLSSISTPAVMIANVDGMNLKTFVAANPSAAVSIDASATVVAVPTIPAIIADFSSRGPSADFGLKPDLMAVGVNVYSAVQTNFPNQGLYDPSHFTMADGTSFSTPMVSGAAAAVKQLFPSLTVAGIKSALTSTASQNVTIDGVTPASLIQAGSGLLNMGNASAVAAVFSPTNLNFGVQAYANSIALTKTLVITNISAGADQYTISVMPLVSGPAINLSSTSTGSIPPGGTASVDVSISATAPLTGGFQGYIKVTSTQTSSSYVIPYWAAIYVPDPTRVLTVSQSASGTNVFNNLADALAAANPGNIIQFADSQTYTLPPPSDPSLPIITISTNAQGVPLHGITIRAAAGQTPVLDGSTSTAFADISVVGLRGVLIQGLTINGGDIGIDLLQPSDSVPLSATIDHCTLTNQTASTISLGVNVDNGGDVDITYSTISGASGAGILIQGGAQLTMSNSTVQGGLNDGVDAFDSNVDLISSTYSSNAGTGVYLQNCTGTMTQNTFAGNTGPLGDGTEIYDGTVTVIGNTFNGNQSAGIYTATATSTGSGPTVFIRGNIIQSNTGYGIQSDQALNLKIEGNMIRDNGLGFVARGSTTALLLNSIIIRSSVSSVTDPAQNNGVYADVGSNVTLVNDTVYKNQLHGIAQVSGSTLSVWNTIVTQNSGGDLSGLSAGSSQFSMIGGDPKFTNPNPGSDDYSLASGSPAINAGSNSAPSLPFLDYLRQFRVAAAGSLPGSGVVDQGALEAGSSYPLSYPLLVSGPNQVLNDTFITGFAEMNPATSSTQSTFAAYDPTGALVSGQTNPTAAITFVPGSQVPILDFQLFGFTAGATKLGAVLSSSTQKSVGFFLIFDNLFSRLADGVDVSSRTYTDSFLMRHEFDADGRASYQIFNPGVNPANVTASLLDSSGNNLEPAKTITLQAKGSSLFTFNAVASSSGYVHLKSDRPITGLEIWGNTAEISALPAAPAGTDTRLFFPHIAVNAGYTTQIGVINAAPAPADLRLTAFANDGSILGIPALRTVNAGGQLLESASSLFGLGAGDLVTGYVEVESDQAAISGFSAFTWRNGNVLQASAAVPSESVPQPKLFFSHIASQVAAGSGGNYQTGIALLNPFGTPISYTLKVFDGTGAQVAQVTDTLGPHVKIAKYLSHPTPGVGFFTQPIVLSSGHVEVTTNYQLLGFELFFTDGLTQLATVMAQFPD